RDAADVGGIGQFDPQAGVGEDGVAQDGVAPGRVALDRGDHYAGAVGAGIAGDARGVGDDVALARAGPADEVVLGGDAGQVARVHGVAGRRVPVRQDADQVALNPVARGLDGHAAAVGGDDVADDQVVGGVPGVGGDEDAL